MSPSARENDIRIAFYNTQSIKSYLWRGRYAPFDLFPYEWAIDKPIDGTLSGLSSITSNASLIAKELNVSFLQMKKSQLRIKQICLQELRAKFWNEVCYEFLEIKWKLPFA